jgi:hypothetical protein
VLVFPVNSKKGQAMAVSLNGALERLRRERQEFVEQVKAGREAGKQAAHQAIVDGLSYRALAELAREADAMPLIRKSKIKNVPTDEFEREAFVEAFHETCVNAMRRADPKSR